MSIKTAQGLVDFVKSKLGTHYAYGAKGEILTKTKIYSWARMYPNIYTQSYINKLLGWVGEYAVDCSGLISWYTGIIRGSSNYQQTGTNKISPSKLTDGEFGWAVWKQGHIGILLSSNKVIEAKGINYGTIESNLMATPWVNAFKIVDIDYTDFVSNKNGWEKVNTATGSEYIYYKNGELLKDAWLRDNDRWYVFDGQGFMIHDNWFYENGRWYYLAGDGGMISNQWLYYKDHWYYFDGAGVCLTNTWYKYQGKWYYLDDTGAMHKGMLYDNGEWYYMGDDGKLITDTNIVFSVKDDGALKFSGLINKED